MFVTIKKGENMGRRLSELQKRILIMVYRNRRWGYSAGNVKNNEVLIDAYSGDSIQRFRAKPAIRSGANRPAVLAEASR